MIVHSIVTYVPPAPAYTPAWKQTPEVVTQEQLDALLRDNPNQKGMYVKYGTITAKDLFQAFYVLDVKTTLDGLETSYNGKAKIIEIINLGTDYAQKRWDCAPEFTPLNEEELAALITNNALVLHRVKAATS